MMADRSPLFVESDDAGNVTNFAEFVSGTDVVPETLGGTGITDFSSYVSSTASSITGFNVVDGVISINPGNQIDELNVSGTIQSTVSALTVATCPVPQPYGFMQTNTNGTAASTETRIGADATVAIAQSNLNDISWHLTEDYFMLSAAGVYEITANMISTVAASTSFTLAINKNGSPINSADSMIHSSIDPTQTSIQAVFLCAAGDYIDATFEDDGSTDITCNPGSSLLVKRLS